MAHQNLGKVIGTIVAAEDLSADLMQYRMVELTSTGWALPSAGGVRVQGVLLNKPAAGQAAEVMVGEGTCPLRCAVPIAAGVKVCSDTQGRARGTAAYSGDHLVAVLQEAATAVNATPTALFQYQGAGS